MTKLTTSFETYKKMLEVGWHFPCSTRPTECLCLCERAWFNNNIPVPIC